MGDFLCLLLRLDVNCFKKSLLFFLAVIGGCSDKFNLKLGAQSENYLSYQPIDVAGDYEINCVSESFPVYKHTSTELYFYYVEDTETNNKYWYITKEFGGDSKPLIIGVYNDICPDSIATWIISDGEGESDFRFENDVTLTNF